MARDKKGELLLSRKAVDELEPSGRFYICELYVREVDKSEKTHSTVVSLESRHILRCLPVAIFRQEVTSDEKRFGGPILEAEEITHRSTLQT
jgi:hypothetical protein